MSNRLPDFRTWAYRTFAGLIVAVLISATLVQPVTGSEPDVTFGETKVENFYPNGIRFSVKIVVQDYKGRIDFYYRLGGGEWTTYQASCSAKTKDSVEYYSCIFSLDYEFIPPQLPVSYKWRLVGSVDRYSMEKTFLYENAEFDWNSINNDEISIWWHEHSFEFAEQVLSIAETALQKQEVFYGVKLEYPVRLVIQNSQEEFLVWSDTPAYTPGGKALPWFGTTVQIVELDRPEFAVNNWLNEVVPHEISHLYFFQATGGHDANPPKWLDEGMAGYSEVGDHDRDWSLVRQAIQQSELIPLSELRNDFPEDDEKVSLAYAESSIAVMYMVETYGPEGLNKLFSAYKAGEISDTVFMQAFGRDLSGFEQDWQAWVVDQRGESTGTLQIVLIFIVLSLACGGALLVMVVLFIAMFDKKIKIQPVG